MATLREIRGRIKGVKSTQQITKAMKMVAAAKLRRSQDRILAARPYAYKMRDLLGHLAQRADTDSNPLMKAREEVKNILVIVVTADRGLCGGFNSNVIKQTHRLIDEEYAELYKGGKVQLVCVGRLGNDHFTKRDYKVAVSLPGVFNTLKYDWAKQVAGIASEKYLSGEVDKVFVIYNEFKNVLSPNLRTETFLPIAVPQTKTTAKEKKSDVDYIYEPDAAGIINALVPRHMEIQVWRMLLESNAAEQAARMTAMDSATENAKELIQTLNLFYNRARQATITKEILEIVGGAEALKQAAE
jgi:F-type H+-transporting ATPase subunit gamma